MKITGQKYEIMKAAMSAVVESEGKQNIINAIKDNEAGVPRSAEYVLWQFWHIAWRNLHFDDTLPFFADGTWKRVYPHDHNFDLYSDDANDDHIYTALKKIGKELGII